MEEQDNTETHPIGPSGLDTGVGLDHWEGDFPTTHWSLVFEGDQANTSKALAALSGRYWYPLYAFLRKRGHRSHDAQDLTQGFFVDLLSRDGLKGADPSKGAFRSYLLGAIKHYVSRVRAHDTAQKRGGGVLPISIDQEMAEQRFQNEPADASDSPDKTFYRNWALTVLQEVMLEVEKDYWQKGKGATFDALKIYLTGEAERGDYRDVAERLDTNETNVRTMVKRLRQRFRKFMNEHVELLVESPDDVEEEINFLFQVVSS